MAHSIEHGEIWQKNQSSRTLQYLRTRHGALRLVLVLQPKVSLALMMFFEPFDKKREHWKFRRGWIYISMSGLGPPPGPGGLPLGFDAAITSSIRKIIDDASVAALITCSFTFSGS